VARIPGKGRALIVDDDEDLCITLTDSLQHQGFDAAFRTSANAALALLGKEDFDVVLSDLGMQGRDGLDLCKQSVADHPDVPVVIMTGLGSLEAAVGAIRAGAYDFLTKPLELASVVATVERAVSHRKVQSEVRRLRQHAAVETRGPSEMIGASAPMQKVFELVRRLGETDASVLIAGESGTGKELVARAIHASSRRRTGPFVAINCAAVPEALLESELFGHTKGAFTDARQSRPGLFLQANGGTLLLDEIGEMSLGMQVRLLRALQERMVRPVGGDRETPVDTRILAATNRDLDVEVKERRFREDLYYRINVVRIDVPPLRARGSDVLDLAQAFIERFASAHHTKVEGLTPAAAERLLAYSWPGNVRELQNCIERAVALARYGLVGVDDLPEKMRPAAPASLAWKGNGGGDDKESFIPVHELERHHVLRVLAAVQGNKTAAASVLGFDRRTLYRKLERYGVELRSEEVEEMKRDDGGALAPSDAG
jgi:two-component system response regulator HydG